MREKLQIFMVVFLCSAAAFCQTVNIIPQPVSVAVKTGSFEITKQTKRLHPALLKSWPQIFLMMTYKLILSLSLR